MPLRKVCRRPETDYRLQQLHAVNEAASAEQQKSSVDAFAVSALRASIPAETTQKQHNAGAAPVAPVLHGIASLVAKVSVLEPNKVETGNVVDAGSSNNVTAGGSNNPIVLSEKIPEGKPVV